MGKRFAAVALSLVVCALCLVSCAKREEAPEDGDVRALARAFVEMLSNGDFSGAAEGFDGAMKQAMPPEKLREAWESLVREAGTFQGQVSVRTAREMGYDAAYVTCKFERRTIDVKVVFNAEREIGGLWFVPSP